MGSNTSFDEKSDIKSTVKVSEIPHSHVAFKESQLDTAAQLVASQSDAPLDPAEAARIRKKIDWHIMPLMCSQ